MLECLKECTTQLKELTLCNDKNDHMTCFNKSHITLKELPLTYLRLPSLAETGSKIKYLCQ